MSVDFWRLTRSKSYTPGHKQSKLRSDKSLSVSPIGVKVQQELSPEDRGFKPDLLVGVPTSNISNCKSAMQSEILLQNAGESLVDLTIDSISPMEETGQALLESTPSS